MSAIIDSRLMTFRKLLAGEEQYVVPIYQRDYSWTTSQVEQLWDDIVNTIDQGHDEHFMGAIVVDQSEHPKLALIDGQQRMATISTLMCVVRDLASEYGDDQLAKAIDSWYLGALNLETRQQEPKLVLNENDNIFYRDNIVNKMPDADISRLGKSSKALWDAYLFLSEQVRARIRENGEKEFARTLVQLESCISHRLIMIEILVQDLSNAYLIFETLNDRGLELSVSDLLKNHLFSRSEKHLDEVKKLWEDINGSLSRQDMTQFIRYYWISTHDIVRNTELYRAIRDQVKNPIQVVSFVKHLKRAAEDFNALNDSDHWMWEAYSSKAINVEILINQLNLFRITQCYPVLLAAREKLTDDLFAKVLEIVVMISFRYSIICGFNPNRLEPVYNKVSLFIRKDSPTSIEAIFDQLRVLYPDDSDFKHFFALKRVFNAPLARYILGEIANYFSGTKEIITNTDSRQVNLEHIMPKNLADNSPWLEAFSDAERQDYVNRLGNMTLLLASDNRRLGNKSFDEKCSKVYSKATLQITREIVSYPIWTPEQIEKRQQEMAEIASKIWFLNY